LFNFLSKIHEVPDCTGRVHSMARRPFRKPINTLSVNKNSRTAGLPPRIIE
jgi:hypothetical protein